MGWLGSVGLGGSTLDGVAVGSAGDGETSTNSTLVVAMTEPVRVRVRVGFAVGVTGVVGSDGLALLNLLKVGVVSRLINCQVNGAVRIVLS